MSVSACCQCSELRRGKHRGAGVLLLLAALPCLPAAAMEMPEATQIHGFVTQGLISSTGNNFFGPSKNGVSWEFTELGVNASYRPDPDLQFSAQLLSCRAGGTDNGRVRLDYGFVDYTFSASESGRWGVMAGKIKNPLGFYNTTRDVAFTRPSILLPQSIYFDRARNFALSAPGASVYGERVGEGGDLYLQLAALRPQVDDQDTKFAFLGVDRPGNLDGDASYIGRLLFDRDGGRLRLALSAAQINMSYRPGAGDALSAGSIRFEPAVLSAQFNAERWSLTSEYALERVSRQGFGAPVLDTTNTSEQCYVQGTYRFAARWEGLLRYDVLYLDRADRDGARYAALSGNPAYARYAKDWTVGVRYDVTPSFMLRGEFHSVDGTAWLPFEDNPDPFGTSRRWNMFLLQGSYRF